MASAFARAALGLASKHGAASKVAMMLAGPLGAAASASSSSALEFVATQRRDAAAFLPALSAFAFSTSAGAGSDKGLGAGNGGEEGTGAGNGGEEGPGEEGPGARNCGEEGPGARNGGGEQSLGNGGKAGRSADVHGEGAKFVRANPCCCFNEETVKAFIRKEVMEGSQIYSQIMGNLLEKDRLNRQDERRSESRRHLLYTLVGVFLELLLVLLVQTANGGVKGSDGTGTGDEQTEIDDTAVIKTSNTMVTKTDDAVVQESNGTAESGVVDQTKAAVKEGAAGSGTVADETKSVATKDGAVGSSTVADETKSVAMKDGAVGSSTVADETKSVTMNDGAVGSGTVIAEEGKTGSE